MSKSEHHIFLFKTGDADQIDFQLSNYKLSSISSGYGCLFGGLVMFPDPFKPDIETRLCLQTDLRLPEKYRFISSSSTAIFIVFAYSPYSQITFHLKVSTTKCFGVFPNIIFWNKNLIQIQQRVTITEPVLHFLFRLKILTKNFCLHIQNNFVVFDNNPERKETKMVVIIESGFVMIIEYLTYQKKIYHFEINFHTLYI